MRAHIVDESALGNKAFRVCGGGASYFGTILGAPAEELLKQVTGVMEKGLRQL